MFNEYAFNLLSPPERRRLRRELNAAIAARYPLTRLRNALPALVMLCLLFSAGVSYAASRALPGEALYPIKVGVSEPAAGALLAFSGPLEALWGAHLSGVRLAEAQTLAQRGKLTSAAVHAIDSNFASNLVHLAVLTETADPRDARISNALDIAIERGAALLELQDTYVRA